MGRIIGIIGGMGPLATVDLFEKLVKMTPAGSDQEHHQILIFNNSKIPSRMAAGLGQGEDPLPELLKTAKCLEQAGADFLIMPCHTAHIWFDGIQKAINIPLISLIETTVTHIKQHHPHVSGKILLLSSQATMKHRLYQEAFQKKGMTIQIPTPAEQMLIDMVIQHVKTNSPDLSSIKPLNNMLNRYYERGIIALLGGCTEIPLLFPQLHSKFEKLDPTLMLAKKAINLAKENDGGERE